LAVIGNTVRYSQPEDRINARAAAF